MTSLLMPMSLRAADNGFLLATICSVSSPAASSNSRTTSSPSVVLLCCTAASPNRNSSRFFRIVRDNYTLHQRQSSDRHLSLLALRLEQMFDDDLGPLFHRVDVPEQFSRVDPSGVVQRPFG